MKIRSPHLCLEPQITFEKKVALENLSYLVLRLLNQANLALFFLVASLLEQMAHKEETFSQEET